MMKSIKIIMLSIKFKIFKKKKKILIQQKTQIAQKYKKSPNRIKCKVILSRIYPILKNKNVAKLQFPSKFQIKLFLAMIAIISYPQTFNNAILIKPRNK